MFCIGGACPGLQSQVEVQEGGGEALKSLSWCREATQLLRACGMGTAVPPAPCYLCVISCVGQPPPARGCQCPGPCYWLLAGQYHPRQQPSPLPYRMMSSLMLCLSTGVSLSTCGPNGHCLMTTIRSLWGALGQKLPFWGLLWV